MIGEKEYFLFLATLFPIGSIFLGWQVPQTIAAKQPKILEFETIVGVPPALTGKQNR